jgi:DNA-binding SARP family transcriptional activator
MRPGFERLLGEAHASLGQGNALLAESLLERGLSLWRGAAFGEFAYEQFARAEAERLEELRLLALERRLEARLGLGRHAEALPELRALVAAHPLREGPRGQPMLALYRCGRQAEALELYAQTREILRDQLGLEPGVELRELQRRILTHDPTLQPSRALLDPLPPLPSPPNRLLGRERELAELG